MARYRKSYRTARRSSGRAGTYRRRSVGARRRRVTGRRAVSRGSGGTRTVRIEVVHRNAGIDRPDIAGDGRLMTTAQLPQKRRF